MEDPAPNTDPFQRCRPREASPRGSHLDSPNGVPTVPQQSTRGLGRVAVPSGKSLAFGLMLASPTLWCTSWVPWLRIVGILVLLLAAAVVFRLVEVSAAMLRRA